MRISTTARAKMIFMVLLLTLVAVAVPVRTANAAIGGCNSDPVITLSNGQVVDLAAHVGDTVAHVTSVTYSLYGPMDLTIRSYSDPSELAPVTHFTWHPEQDPGSGFYTAFLTVQDSSSRATVAFTMTIGANKYSVSGHTGDLLEVFN